MNFGVIMYQTSASKGQELVAQRMTRELASRGGRAVLITSRFHDFEPVIFARELRRKGGYVSYYDDELGITVYRVESRKVDWPPRRIEFTNFVSLLDRIAEELDLDVLITHSTLWNGPDLTALFVSWKKRIVPHEGGKRPLFCHMSHYQPPTSRRYSKKERGWRQTWNDYVLGRIIREADILLVATPAAERHMVELGARRDQCLLFPGGIEVRARHSEEELAKFRREHGLSSRDRLVTFLGTVEERKNVKAVLRVANSLARLKGAVFVIAGRAEGRYADSVLRAAESAPNVVVLGEISDEEKSALIRASYLNLIMSRLEALGLTQLEFMSRGVPVVTSGVGGQSWIVRNGQTGVVLDGPDDIRGAASAVAELLGDKAYRERLSRNAEKFASQFTMPVLVKNLMRKLKEITKREAEERLPAAQGPKGRVRAARAPLLFPGMDELSESSLW